jgi:uncharacterized protein with FMN-binding domain
VALERRPPETPTRLSPRAARRKRRLRKKTGRTALFVVLGLILLLVLIWSEFIRSTPDASTDVTKGLVLGPVESGKYADDITKGHSKRGFIKVKVQVELMNGEIQKIKILSHRRLLWWPKAKGVPEKIADAIKARQNTRVRAISGATISSKATMLAVQDALTNNQKKNRWDPYERTGEGGRWDDKY